MDARRPAMAPCADCPWRSTGKRGSGAFLRPWMPGRGNGSQAPGLGVPSPAVGSNDWCWETCACVGLSMAEAGSRGRQPECTAPGLTGLDRSPFALTVARTNEKLTQSRGSPSMPKPRLPPLTWGPVANAVHGPITVVWRLSDRWSGLLVKMRRRRTALDLRRLGQLARGISLSCRQEPIASKSSHDASLYSRMVASAAMNARSPGNLSVA